MTYFGYPTVVSLGGISLTDESRQPLQEDRDAREIRVELASGRVRKFTKEVKRKWTISWDTVAQDASHTVDSGASRNELRNLVQAGNGPFSFVITDGRNTTETYSVWVTSFTHTLKFRRKESYYYTMEIQLEEQG